MFVVPDILHQGKANNIAAHDQYDRKYKGRLLGDAIELTEEAPRHNELIPN